MLKDILLEIEARNEEIKNHSFATKTQIDNIKNYYRIPFVWSSNAIEGNTLTLEETEVILGEGITIKGHSLKESFEVIGGNAGYDYLFSLLTINSRINSSVIREFHKLCTMGQEDVTPGKYRTHNVMITRLEKKLPNWQKVPELMDIFDTWLEQNKETNPILFASIAHARLVSIHPFADGNGRTARLLLNAILIKDGYLPVCVAPINRMDYITSLRTYNMGKRSVNDFVEVIAKIELQTQKDYMRLMSIPFTY